MLEVNNSSVNTICYHLHILCHKAAACNSCCAYADTACDKGALRIVGYGVLVDSDLNLVKSLLQLFACDVKVSEVDQHKVVVCSARYKSEALL